MVIVIGTGIIGLYTAYELLKRGLEVTLLDFQTEGEASKAAVGMLAPIIETKPLENRLHELMISSKKIWDEMQNDQEIADLIELKNNSSLLISMNEDDHQKIILKKNFLKSSTFNQKFLLQKKH